MYYNSIMKKQNIINLIRYHIERNENAFRSEAIDVARYFDTIGDDQLAEYIMSLVAESNLYSSQSMDFEGDFLKQMDITTIDPLNLPVDISKDIKGIINAINHNIGINKFIFEGMPGTGKTEAAKHVARLLDRALFYVDFSNLVDSKLGQTNKNISDIFREINLLPHGGKTVVMFDELDAIALDRINTNDVREMGRATSAILRELDRMSSLNSEVVIIATTNLFHSFDKALIRRFDAVINFDRYNKEDLIEIADYYFSSFSRSFKNITKDTRLFKKILNLCDNLPYPGDLRNVIKMSLAFSDGARSNDYLSRLYSYLISDIDNVSINQLYSQGFTVREIEKLKGSPKSSVSRGLNKE